MIREIFIIKNVTNSEIELKDFGLLIPSGVTVDLSKFDNATLSDELYNYLLIGDLIRIIDGVEINDIENSYDISQPYYGVSPTFNNVIQVAKTGTTYDTINDALDSITDNSSDNRYLIELSPEIFIEDVTLKPFVSIGGVSRYSRIEGQITANYTGITSVSSLYNLELRTFNEESININIEGNLDIQGVNIKTYYTTVTGQSIKASIIISDGIVSINSDSNIVLYNTNGGTISKNNETIYHVTSSNDVMLSALNTVYNIISYEQNNTVSLVYNDNSNTNTSINVKESTVNNYLYNANPSNTIIPVIHDTANNKTIVSNVQFLLDVTSSNASGVTLVGAYNTSSISSSIINYSYNSFGWFVPNINNNQVYVGGATNIEDQVKVVNCIFNTESDFIPPVYTVGGTNGSVIYNLTNSQGTSITEKILTDTLQIGTYSGITKFLDEDDLSSDDAFALASQRSIKYYIDNKESNPLYAFSKTQANGTQDEGIGISVTRVSTGTYDYTFDNAVSDTNYGVFAQPFGTTTDTNSQISNVTTTGFRVEIGRGDNGTTPDVLVDTEHSIGVFGVPISGATQIPVVSVNAFNAYTGTTAPNQFIPKVPTATENNVPTFDANGNIQDSGYNIDQLTGGTSGGGTWGSITGILSNQTDLQNELDDKTNLSLFDTYTGTTAPNTYLSINDFNIYSGNTQTELDGKEDVITGAATTITGDNLTINRVLVSDGSGKVGVSDVTTTELEYLTGVTSNIQNQLDNKVENITFDTYTGTTESKLWNVFEPFDGTTDDTIRFEEYADIQLANGQPIYLHDPNDFGFPLSGLTTGKSYNKLPWIGVNGGNSAPRLKLSGISQVFTTSGIRGVELYIEPGADVQILGLSEHASVDLTEIRFGIGTANSLTVRAVNLTCGRVEGQTGTSDFIIKDRSNIQVQNLNEIENVYVEGGSILIANWVRINTLIKIGNDGVSEDTDGAIVTLAKPQNLTSGKVIIYGGNSILTASNFPIEVVSGATNNVILGANNTITDNGTDTIILQDLTSGGASGATWGSITGTLSDQTDLQTELDSKEDTITGAATTITGSNLAINRALVSNGSGKVGVSSITSTELGYLTGVSSNIQTQIDNKLDNIEFNTYTGTTAPNTFVNVDGDTIIGDLRIEQSLFVTGTTATQQELETATLLGAITSSGKIVVTTTPALNVSEEVTDVTGSTLITEISGIYYVDTTLGNITLTIPNASVDNDASKVSIIKKGGNNNVIITTVGGTQNIGNQITQVISQTDKGLTIVADNDNSKWIVVQDSRYVEGTQEGEIQYWDNTLKVWKPSSNDITWDQSGLTFTVGGNSIPPTFQVNATDDIVYINTSGLTGVDENDDLGFYADGRGAFGNSVTVDRLRNNVPGNVPRALSLIDTTATLRVWRYVDDANDPAVELIWGTDDEPDSVNNAWWDFFLDGANDGTDSFAIRRRTQNLNNIILEADISGVTTPYNFGIGQKFNFNEYTNPTLENGDLWYTGTSLFFYDGTDTFDLLDRPTGLTNIQIRRTTTVTLGATWADITFDTVDVETDTNVLEHDTNTDRILIKQEGVYLIQYEGVTNPGGEFRVRLNDSTVLNGSQKNIFTTVAGFASVDPNLDVSNSFITTITNSTSYITLQGQRDTATVQANLSLKVIKLDYAKGSPGPQGPKGDPGDGTKIKVTSDVLTGSTVATLNFVSGLTATMSGTEIVNIGIEGFTTDATKNKIQLTDSVGSQNLNPSTPATLTWGQTDFIDTDVFTFTTGTSSITVKEDGLYELSFNINGNGATNRRQPGIQFRLNSTTISQTLTSCYARNSGNPVTNNTLTPYLITLSEDDVLDVSVFELGDSGTVDSVADASFVRITYLGKTS